MSENEQRYRVWKINDDSGEHEVLDFSRDEPSTVFIGTRKDAEHEAEVLNQTEMFHQTDAYLAS